MTAMTTKPRARALVCYRARPTCERLSSARGPHQAADLNRFDHLPSTDRHFPQAQLGIELPIIQPRVGGQGSALVNAVSGASSARRRGLGTARCGARIWP